MVQADCLRHRPIVRRSRPRFRARMPAVCAVLLLLLLSALNPSLPASVAQADFNPISPPASPTDGCAPSFKYSMPSLYSPMAMAHDPLRNRLFVANRDTGTLTLYSDYALFLPFVATQLFPATLAQPTAPVGAARAPAAISSSGFPISRTLSGLPGVQGVAFDASRNRVYVVGGGNLWIVDADSMTVWDWLGLGTGSYAVAYNPANSKIYVTDYDKRVTIVDAEHLSKQTITSSTAHPLAEPAYIAVNRVTNRVYVSNHNGGLEGWVSVISGNTDQIQQEIYLNGDLYGIAADAVRNRIYVASIGVAQVYAINGATDTPLGYIQIKRSGGWIVPLRMVATNAFGSDTHLWLGSAAGDLEPGGVDRVILLSGDWPNMGQPLGMAVAPSPEGGLLVDSLRGTVFVSSAASNMITAVQDNVTLCSAPLGPGEPELSAVVHVYDGPPSER